MASARVHGKEKARAHELVLTNSLHDPKCMHACSVLHALKHAMKQVVSVVHK